LAATNEKIISFKDLVSSGSIEASVFMRAYIP
jgi:hypothetical protein